MSVRAGTCLDGRYRLSERLAVGGMGEVWAGADEVLGRKVAVKVLRAELAEDEAFRKRFRAEARTAGGLPHNGIAAVFDYGETSVGPDGVSPSPHAVQGDGIAYLVMELVPGEPLSTILTREGPLPAERAANLLAQAARALHAAHLRGVVHRDVKPANLMVTPEGRVKVTDFGIARPTDHEPLTMTGQVMGTAHYLAPELAKGHDASPLSDVYALGVVLYECLAGRRPFEGENQVLVATAHLSQQPPPLPAAVPAQAAAVVAAAMEKEPQDRIQSAEAMAVALEKLYAHQPGALDGLRPGGSPFHGAAPMIGPAGGVFAGGAMPWPQQGLAGATGQRGTPELERGQVEQAMGSPTAEPSRPGAYLDSYPPVVQPAPMAPKHAVMKPDQTELFGAAGDGPGRSPVAPMTRRQAQGRVPAKATSDVFGIPVSDPGGDGRRTPAGLPPYNDPPRRGLGAWAWLLGAVAVALIISGIYLMLNLTSSDSPKVRTSPSASGTAVVDSSNGAVVAPSASVSGRSSATASATRRPTTTPSSRVSSSVSTQSITSSPSPTRSVPSPTATASASSSASVSTPSPSVTPSASITPSVSLSVSPSASDSPTVNEATGIGGNP